MDLRQIFKEQMQVTDPLTQEQVDQLASAGDYFGTEFQAGEQQLFAMFAEFVPEEKQTEDFPSDIAIQMDKLCIRSQNQLEESYIHTDDTPVGSITMPRFVNKQLIDEEDGGTG